VSSGTLVTNWEIGSNLGGVLMKVKDLRQDSVYTVSPDDMFDRVFSIAL
jgi:hypothetical protein